MMFGARLTLWQRSTPRFPLSKKTFSEDAWISLKCLRLRKRNLPCNRTLLLRWLMPRECAARLPLQASSEVVVSYKAFPEDDPLATEFFGTHNQLWLTARNRLRRGRRAAERTLGFN